MVQNAYNTSDEFGVAELSADVFADLSADPHSSGHACLSGAD
jgi:hypothetical protein